MDIRKITIDNFDEEVIQAREPILVDFYADWCSYCRAVSPILDELAGENVVRIAKLNIDTDEELAAKYGVMTIPTLALFKDGKIVNKLVGGVDKEDIETLIS